ncbi:lysin A, N-acetylmuramoyl-L-alanine amidase domain [Ruegeria phage RpAliso]|nr:lysin A, N-acetylmuramoyl-L-alanine amidase domain [Ruegeria phage RpAliso]
MIRNHKMVGAVSVPSPNFTNREITPRFIVMHYTAGWEVQSALDTFRNPASQVSAQITIDTDGVVYQHVPFNLRAWHAGPSRFAGFSDLNSHSIGIEFVNPGFLRKAKGGYTDAYSRFVSEDHAPLLVEASNARAGSGTFYWPVYTNAQLEAGERLVKELIDAYPIMDIVSHEEIDTRGWKTDPGPAFPMNRFRALLRDRRGDVVNYEVTASSLNVRSGPGTNFPVVGSLYNGDTVVALDTRGDWVKVTSDHWVHAGYLRRSA